ncbi:MAG: uroporphyrinogen-III synthase [Balneolia bacterium]|nr:uroporphyrinogen-III synthase [Balneolia bacterium]
MRAYVPVWFTRPLSGDEVRLARANGIEPIVHPLIAIQFEPVSGITEQALKLPDPDAVLFTSRNAVDAFLACRVARPGWLAGKPVFAVGERTAARLTEAGLNPIFPTTRQDGTEVATIIVNTFAEGAVIWHFCAKNKRPEAEQIIQQGKLNYHSITSYSTILLDKVAMPEEPFEAVVFYSPSAVQAFVNSGVKVAPDIQVVSIGRTTAQALRDAGISNVTIADRPSTESLIKAISELQF